jgi:hypothetical protein
MSPVTSGTIEPVRVTIPVFVKPQERKRNIEHAMDLLAQIEQEKRAEEMQR